MGTALFRRKRSRTGTITTSDLQRRTPRRPPANPSLSLARQSPSGNAPWEPRDGSHIRGQPTCTGRVGDGDRPRRPGAGPARRRRRPLPRHAPCRRQPAQRRRQLLAHRRRALDRRPSRLPHPRPLLLHLRREPLDRQGMAVADPLCRRSRARRLAGHGGARRRLRGARLRPLDALPSARPQAALRAPLRGGRLPARRAPCHGAAARAGFPGDGRLCGGAHARGGRQARAIAVAAAADGAVGKSPRRLHLRHHDGRRARPRRHRDVTARNKGTDSRAPGSASACSHWPRAV